jgi:hypothetical protein
VQDILLEVGVDTAYIGDCECDCVTYLTRRPYETAFEWLSTEKSDAIPEAKYPEIVFTFWDTLGPANFLKQLPAVDLLWESIFTDDHQHRLIHMAEALGELDRHEVITRPLTAPFFGALLKYAVRKGLLAELALEVLGRHLGSEKCSQDSYLLGLLQMLCETGDRDVGDLVAMALKKRLSERPREDWGSEEWAELKKFEPLRIYPIYEVRIARAEYKLLKKFEDMERLEALEEWLIEYAKAHAIALDAALLQ